MNKRLILPAIFSIVAFLLTIGEKIYIVQGNYGNKWDNLTYHKTYKQAKRMKDIYDNNKSCKHRIKCWFR